MTGWARVARLVLRRDRLLLPLWVLLLGLAPLTYAVSFRSLYATQAAREEFLVSLGTSPALTALYGRLVDASLGALTVWRSSFVLLLVALAALLTVVRHTRAEEENGRRELLASAPIGRAAPTVAAVVVTVAACVGVGLLETVALMAAGLGGAGSLAFGASCALTGAVFAGVAALLAQVTTSARTARSLAGVVLGVAFVLRAVADLSGGLSWVAWASPLGWAARARPFAGDHWWALVLPLAASAVLAGVAVRAAGRRDLGAGLVTPRPGPSHAARSLLSPLGLAWRLQRTTLLGWTVALVVLGGVVGGSTGAVAASLQDNPQVVDLLKHLGGTGAVADVFLAVVMSSLGLMAAACGVQATLRLHGEEAAGRAEPVLATAVGRARWAMSHGVLGVLGPLVALVVAGVVTGLTYGLSSSTSGGALHEAGRVTAAALVQVPAVWVLVGVALLAFGAVPRQAAAVAWGAFGLVLLLGEVLAVVAPTSPLLDLSPFAHVPRVPAVAATALPMVALVGVATVLGAAGLLAFQRRDVS